VRKILLVSGVLALLLSMPRAAAAADDVIDRVLAVVGGDVITQSDVEAVRQLHLPPAIGEAGPASAEEPTKDILARLVDRSLMLSEVDRYAPPEPSAEAVDREVQTVRARFATPEAFAAALARVGLDDKFLREILRQDLRIRAYVEERFAVPEEQRRVLVEDWVAGLRRRATITEPDLNAR
jgi:peptidyl-prolyl cis-trans isomerase SurA